MAMSGDEHVPDRPNYPLTTGGARPPVGPAAIRDVLIVVGLALLSLVWLWLPWVTVSDADGRSMSTSGFSALPDSCIEEPSDTVCARGETITTQVWAILLIVTVVAIIGACLLWLAVHEPMLVRATAFCSPLLVVFALADAVALWSPMSTRVSSYNACGSACEPSTLSLGPGPGPFLTVVTGVVCVVFAVRAMSRLPRA
jgi:hypothetical protein